MVAVLNSKRSVLSLSTHLYSICLVLVMAGATPGMPREEPNAVECSLPAKLRPLLAL